MREEQLLETLLGALHGALAKATRHSRHGLYRSVRVDRLAGHSALLRVCSHAEASSRLQRPSTDARTSCVEHH